LFIILEVIPALFDSAPLKFLRNFLEILAVLTEGRNENFLLSLGPLVRPRIRSCASLAHVHTATRLVLECAVNCFDNLRGFISRRI